MKMPKEFEADFETPVAVDFPRERAFLFEAGSGERLAANVVD